MDTSALFLLLIVPLAGVIAYAGYHFVSIEQGISADLRRQLQISNGTGVILNKLLEEVGASWTRSGSPKPEVKKFADLGRIVASILPKLISSAPAAAVAKGVYKHTFSDADFTAAGVADSFKRIADLVAAIDDQEITRHWNARRIGDLMAIMRECQRSIFRQIGKEEKEDVTEDSSPLLGLIRNEADSKVICASVVKQVRDRIKDKHHDEAMLQNGIAALEAVVLTLSYMRNERKKPFTIGALTLAMTPHGIENLYRQVRTISDSGAGWPKQCHALRVYVESLPGWDGRLPMPDMTLASHALNAEMILAELLRVK